MTERFVAVPGGWRAGGPSGMTAERLARLVVDRFGDPIRASEGEIRAEVGRVPWLFVWPSWKTLTANRVLLVLIRVGIEVTLGLCAPWLVPLLDALWPLIAQFFVSGPVRDRFEDLCALVRALPQECSRPSRVILTRVGVGVPRLDRAAP